MEANAAVNAFSALAHPHRLAVFRLLMAAGPAGLTAGELAETLGLPPSSLAFHTAHLERSGLLAARRVQRNVFYAIDVAGTRALVRYLTEDCCQGNPEICGFAVTAAEADCCAPARPTREESR